MIREGHSKSMPRRYSIITKGTFSFMHSFAAAVILYSLIPGGLDLLGLSIAGKRPNIIVVMTDDQGMGDLSCLGNPILKTPNLDKFYALSTRFTDFHVSPTCAPTRSAVLSGRHEF